MKRQTAKWVRKAEEDMEGARELGARKPPLRDLVCFHCQQAAEKYLKALLQELGAVVPKTHELEELQVSPKLWPQDALAGSGRPAVGGSGTVRRPCHNGEPFPPHTSPFLDTIECV